MRFVPSVFSVVKSSSACTDFHNPEHNKETHLDGE